MSDNQKCFEQLISSKEHAEFASLFGKQYGKINKTHLLLSFERRWYVNLVERNVN